MMLVQLAILFAWQGGGKAISSSVKDLQFGPIYLKIFIFSLAQGYMRKESELLTYRLFLHVVRKANLPSSKIRIRNTHIGLNANETRNSFNL